MKKTTKLLIAAALLVPLTMSGPSLAHHSYAMFDMQDTIQLKGKIAMFKWQNPHAFIQVDVPVKGRIERWSIEMTSPNNLVQQGWKRTSLRRGDEVTLYVHPLRTGAQGAAYSGVRLANGSTLGNVE